MKFYFEDAVAGTRTLYDSVLANALSDAGVNDACGTANHRFTKISVPLTDQIKYQGQRLVAVVSLGTNTGSIVSKTAVENPVGTLADIAIESGSGDLIVPAGYQLFLDPTLDLVSNGRQGLLIIKGQVRCDPAMDHELKLAGIIIDGPDSIFECGKADSRYTKNLKITLSGQREWMADHSGRQGIVSHNEGVLSLHGVQNNLTWLHIDQNAEAGAVSVHLEGAVDWPINSKIAIASSGFTPFEAEERTITGISADRRTLTFTEPLKYRHLAFKKAYSNNANTKTWNLDQRAEVALLTRNILIQGAPILNSAGSASSLYDWAKCTPRLQGEAAPTDCEGGHIMAMMGGRAYIDSIELYYMGQMSKIARYPFHWHLSGDVTGQYIKNASIHHSFSRCITVHGTDKALVENNVCYEHFGHGYFLEDGNEKQNIFNKNIGFSSRRPPAGREILFSDNQTSRTLSFDAPATFWISNPDNEFVGNVAAGSMGTGFWFALKNSLPKIDPTVFPNRIPLRRFESNVAHSSIEGVSIDGGPTGASRSCTEPVAGIVCNPNNVDDVEIGNSHYDGYPKDSTIWKTQWPTFKNLTIYRTAGTGFWVRSDRLEITDSVFSENTRAVVLSFSEKLSNSLVVARTENFGEKEFDSVTPGELGKNISVEFQTPIAMRIWGAGLYDGAMKLENVHFENFQATATTGGTLLNYTQYPSNTGGSLKPKTQLLIAVFPEIGGANIATVNTMSGISFNPKNPYRKFNFDSIAPPSSANTGNGGAWTQAVLDLDGSVYEDPNLTTAGFSIVASHANSMINGCIDYKDQWKGFVCPQRYVSIAMVRSDYDPDTSKLTYMDGSNTYYSMSYILKRDDIVSYPTTSPQAGGDFRLNVNNKFSVMIGRDVGYTFEPGFLFAEASANIKTQLQLRYVKAGEVTPIIRIPLKPHYVDLKITSAVVLPDLPSLKNHAGTGYFRDASHLYFKIKANVETEEWEPYNNRASVYLCKESSCL